MNDPVKRKIIELVPDIADCFYCNGQGWTGEHDSMGSHNPETGECESCPVQVQCEHCEGTGDAEPKEITLADVLRAVEKVDPKNKYHVRTNGAIGTISPVSPMTHVYAHWNLLEHYDNQTDDLKRFIGKLLEVEEITHKED